MRIGLDGRMLHETGIGTYTFELLKAMLMVSEEHTFVFFLKPQKIEWVKKNLGIFIERGFLELVPAPVDWYGIQEQVQLPKYIRKARLDLMHFPHFNIAVFCPVPFVVTIHDLILLGYPSIRMTRLSPWKFRLKKFAYLFVIRQALKKSKAIFTFTEFGRDDILKYFPGAAKKDKIYVFPEGPGQTDLPEKFTDDKATLLRYNIKKSYLLYVGNAYPHKNLQALILAFDELLRNGWDGQLVIVGKDDDFRKELKESCKTLGIWGNSKEMDRVVFTGYVDPTELASFYTNAIMYVFPSLYEGFALPQLEAMRYLLPVVSSEKTCLPEILKDAVEYCNPEDPKNIVLAIEKILKNPERQEELKKKGKKLLEEYSWDKCARATLMVYQKFATHAEHKKRSL